MNLDRPMYFHFFLMLTLDPSADDLYKDGVKPPMFNYDTIPWREMGEALLSRLKDRQTSNNAISENIKIFMGNEAMDLVDICDLKAKQGNDMFTRAQRAFSSLSSFDFRDGIINTRSEKNAMHLMDFPEGQQPPPLGFFITFKATPREFAIAMPSLLSPFGAFLKSIFWDNRQIHAMDDSIKSVFDSHIGIPYSHLAMIKSFIRPKEINHEPEHFDFSMTMELLNKVYGKQA